MWRACGLPAAKMVGHSGHHDDSAFGPTLFGLNFVPRFIFYRKCAFKNVSLVLIIYKKKLNHKCSHRLTITFESNQRQLKRLSKTQRNKGIMKSRHYVSNIYIYIYYEINKVGN